MLSFKQFIYQFLTEAKIEDFNHLGLTSDNPEHQELVDAYNYGKQKNDPKLPKHDNQIKKQIPTIDHLYQLIQPHLENLRIEKQHKKEDEEAFRTGDVKLIHHDPEKGLKIFKVRNQKGSCAVSQGTKWCTAKKDEPFSFGLYDQTGNDSYVIHLDKEPTNLSRIGIFGIKPFSSINKSRKNFQDKGNNFINDEDWNKIKEKYELHKIPELYGIRKNFSSDQIENLKSNLYKKIDSDSINSNDISVASTNGYLDDSHKQKLNNWLQKQIKNNQFTSDDIYNAKENNYLNDTHINLLKHNLHDKLDNNTATIGDINIASSYNGVDSSHIPKIKKWYDNKLKSYDDKIRSEDIDTDILILSRINAITKDHKNKLKDWLYKKINTGNFNDYDIEIAKKHKFWDNKLHTPLLKKE